MMPPSSRSLDSFAECWCVDFEFCGSDGDVPRVVCVVALETRSGRLVRLFEDELGRFPPYSCGPDSLVVTYFGTAEMNCHRVLGWPIPKNLLDLYVEYTVSRNGLAYGAGGRSLIGALIAHGLDHLAAAEKADMRELILGGGPWNGEQRAAILDYCESDVRALERLLPKMAPAIHVPRALFRGRYVAATSAMEHLGTPIDTETYHALIEHWHEIRLDLITEVDRHGIFEGETFKAGRFAEFLQREGIPWPRLDSGALELKTDTFRQMARAYPKIAPLHELRVVLAQMRQFSLAVGRDGRNRCLLSPFGARSSRHTPQASKYIFGPSAWLRSLIKPAPGYGVAYLDWSQQEIAIAAALSGDKAMMAAYESGDFYTSFAKQAGAIPANGTKHTHKTERDLYKTCALGVAYGMGEQSLAMRTGKSPVEARALLRDHREVFGEFWRWQDQVEHQAFGRLVLHTVFGYPLHVDDGTNPRTVRNFPMQGNGSEMLRIAVMAMQAAGIAVCGPIHDAALVEAPLAELDDTVAEARRIMMEASREVLSGRITVRVDAEVVKAPDRYRDERGVRVWESVTKLLAKMGAKPSAF